MPFDDYNPTVMEHFLNPRNTGELAAPTHTSMVRNPACGDMVKLSLRVQDGVVKEARAKTFGCAAAIASTSALTEMLIGKSLDAARAIKNLDVVAFLGGLPEYKIVCSVVAEDAVREALK